MAVTGSVGKQVVVLGASADEVTGPLYIQALWASGAVAGITDSANSPIWAATAANQMVQFPCALMAQGIKRGAGAGNLYVYLK